MVKVVVTKEIPSGILESLSQNHEVVVVPDSDSSSFKTRLTGELKEATALITTGIPIEKSLLQNAPKLKIVSDISVGYDNFDLNAMREAGVIGTHTPGVLDETVADLTFALLLSASRRVAELDQAVRSGEWITKDEMDFYGSNLHHQTLGIVGMGRIGEKIARRAALGFDMKVLYHNRTAKPDVEKELGVQYVPFETLLADSDFVVLVTPLTKDTYHLMNRKAFQQMKESAFFINVSRGQTVDEAALVEALKNGEIKGAGLDVFQTEPIEADHPLLALKNVTLLPHIGSAVFETRLDMAKLAVQNVATFLNGGTPPSIVPELKA